MKLYRRQNCVFFFLFLFFSALSYANQDSHINFNEYSDKVRLLSAACTSKSLGNFSGFCLSEQYGKVGVNNPIQTSISLAVEILAIEQYEKCEHSDLPELQSLLNKAEKILGTKKFIEEIRPQKEALNNYVNYFYYCKTKAENDLAMLRKSKWFDYMIQKYSGITLVTSSKSLAAVVECILSNYNGTGNDFFVNGLPTQEGGVSVSLMAPIILPLATVTKRELGSMTQYINSENKNYSSVPRPNEFANAVIKCQ
jgi:hypothetical protein